MERQQDEIDAPSDQVRQAGENTPCQAPTEGFNDESSRTRGVLPRWPTLTRSLTTTRTQKESPSFQDSDGLKLPAPSTRPITISSSRYGESGAPSSLPSPISWPQQMHDMPSHPVRTAESHASSSFAPSADNLMDESHPHQLSSSPPEEPVSEIQRGPKKYPKRFLFCFPWVQSRRVRSQILTCFTSGVFLACLLAVCKEISVASHSPSLFPDTHNHTHKE